MEPDRSTWGHTIPLEDVERRTRQMLADRGATDRAFIVHDVGEMEARLSQLFACFPQSTIHAVAVKANPVVGILREVVATGAGLEAASIEEVHLALESGCPPERLVFDSPAKTPGELAAALSLGSIINADNSTELQRIAALISEHGAPDIGLRMNPEVGAGRIESTSVASRGSKFGMSIDEVTQGDYATFRDFPFITGLHVHVGSQGCHVRQLIDGVRRIVDLAIAVNEELSEQRIRFIDIGGGLPTSYDGTPATSIDEYAASLRRDVPELFDGRFRIITEFGRSLHAQCGWTVARVEYVKDDLFVTHVGADMFLRTAYKPNDWPHRFALLDSMGRAKPGEDRLWTIGGPLCFAGDIIGRNVPLPDVDAGDLLVIRDSGAYTLSMWSRHCSRGIPVVLGIREQNDVLDHWVLRRAERPSDLVTFWSAGDERAPTADH